MTVAALYVERGGPYFTMPGVDPWGVERDARLYAGPWPVVAHPPCGPWGRLHHLYRGDEHDCAPAAIRAVQKWGGVVEHPAYSRAWRLARLPWPGEFTDEHDGFTVAVDQVSWGHVARKHTWIYVVGVPLSVVLAGVRTGGTPTHWVAGFHQRGGGRAEYPQSGSAAPPGIKICSSQQRRRTPPAFASWLVELARAARRDQAELALEAG